MHIGRHAEAHPDKPAIIMASTGDVITYAELEARSNQAAQLFRSLGLKVGDAIAIWMENNEHFLPICWGAQRAGLYYTCISSHLTAGEVDYIVGDCMAKLFVTSTFKPDVAAELTALMPKVDHRLMVNGEASGYRSYEAAAGVMPMTPIADEEEGTDMLYSSGTTGRPKGIRQELPGLPFGTSARLSEFARDYYGVKPDSVYLSPAPLYHAAPLRWNIAVHRLGGTCVVMERFDAETALSLIEKYKADCSQWVPTMFVRMLKLPEEVRKKYDVSSMRCAVHAAAPCPVEVKKEMIAWWGPVLYEYYAGTEGNGMTLIRSEEWLTHPGSVGRPLMGKVHIVGEDGETEVPQGEVGTIYFSDSSIDGRVFEYHNDPGKTADSRNAKGWTTLGDVGYLDEEGYLYLTDRKHFMIISGGVNIYPQEVENLLVTHPKVLDVAVFGVPNPDFGEEVKAVVQLPEGRVGSPELAEELMQYCRSRLSSIKCPRSVDFIEEMPRHANGKLYKRILRDGYWGKTDSKIVQ